MGSVFAAMKLLIVVLHSVVLVLILSSVFLAGMCVCVCMY